MEFEKLNILQAIAIVSIGVSLCVAVFTKNTDLATILGSGLVGYIGGVAMPKK